MRMSLKGNKMSPAGSRACAKAGSRNLEQWRNRRSEVTRERTKLADEFRAELLKEMGASITATGRALVESATASYIAIAIASNRFQQGRTNSYMMSDLIRTQGQLNRSLKLLGVKFPISTNDDSHIDAHSELTDIERDIAESRRAGDAQ
jgi:hypothetical protein